MEGVTFTEFLQHLYMGLVQGSIYILLALGLSIIFGLMGIINFGHGAFYMLGAYMGFTVLATKLGGLNAAFFMALLLAPVAMFFIGSLTEWGVMRRIYTSKNPLFSGVLVTYGLSIFLPDFVRAVWGRPGKSFNIPPALSETLFKVGGLDFSSYRAFIVLVALILVPLIWLLLHRTNLGMVIRAGTSNNEMVKVLGIDVSRVWTITFGLGIALAGFAGIMVAPLFAVEPTMGETILIQTFIVVVVGGMGSFIGPVLGALIVGQIWAMTPLLGRTAFVAHYLGGTPIGPQFWEKASDILLFVVMAFVLLVRPRGILGREGAFD
ncbi:MAG: branched-chain amino acid ABC transporter permease [Nitrospinota bacterium]